MLNTCSYCSTGFNSKESAARKFCSSECFRAATLSTPLEARLLKHIRKTKTCWLWTASTHNYGYGKININGKMERAHRLMYELVNGPLKPFERVLHTCDVPQCCNPAHLVKGTQLENIADMKQKKRHAHGETSYAKLKESDVLSIRADARKQKVIALDYGVAKQTISDIKRGRRWKHSL